uniref:Uncharacterized protein n=1 Tax=Lotus japonicus TaxID=34305 RepID=I3ST42_LOTJA|nr:unknown [Lotus japonicus]
MSKIFIFVFKNPTFMSKAVLDEGVKKSNELRIVEAVNNSVRKLTKLDMKLNDALPQINLDQETFTSTTNGGIEAVNSTAAEEGNTHTKIPINEIEARTPHHSLHTPPIPHLQNGNRDRQEIRQPRNSNP